MCKIALPPLGAGFVALSHSSANFEFFAGFLRAFFEKKHPPSPFWKIDGLHLSNSTITMGKSTVHNPDAMAKAAAVAQFFHTQRHVRRVRGMVALALVPYAVIGSVIVVWFSGGREIVEARFSQPTNKSPEPEKK